jgi:hypothetical protein
MSDQVQYVEQLAQELEDLKREYNDMESVSAISYLGDPHLT